MHTFVFTTPPDIVLMKLELQSMCGRDYRHTQICCSSSLTLFLHQGVSLTAQRAAIVVGVELPAYDITKKHLILSGYMGDTVYTHFL